MTTKIEVPTPQQIRVPKGTLLQIYVPDAESNRTPMSLLPGPVEISMVPIESEQVGRRP
jgi:hypothetical protein